MRLSISSCSCDDVQKFMLHIFHDVVFPTSNLHTMHVLHVYPHNFKFAILTEIIEIRKLLFKQELYLKIILSGFLLIFTL